MTAKLGCMVNGVYRNKPVDQTGKILMRVLRSSTCCTVVCFHGLEMEPSSVTNAALFKNLQSWKVSVIIG